MNLKSGPVSVATQLAADKPFLSNRSKYTRFKLGLLLSLLSIAIAHSLWVADRFAYAGYWDDTMMFVSHASGVPPKLSSAIPWVVNQRGEFNSPYVLGLILLTDSVGALSNWTLVLISNLALVGLAFSVYRAAAAFDLNRPIALIAALFGLFLPAFLDQRTWFMPIQHTFTVIFALEAITATRKLLIMRSLDFPNIRAAIAQHALLTALMLLLALGREFGGVLAIFTIVFLLLTGPRRSATYAICSAWLLPILSSTQRAFSGRLGSHTDEALRQFGLNFFAKSDSLGTALQPSIVLILGLTLVVALQAYFLSRRNSITGSHHRHLSFRAPDKAKLQRSINLAIVTIWILSLWIPRLTSHLVASSWPIGFLTVNKVFDERWSYFELAPGANALGLIIIFGVVLFRGTQLTKVAILGSVVMCAPFLLTDISELSANDNIASFSRYAPYFLPAASCITYTLVDVVRDFIEKYQTSRGLLLVVLSMSTGTLTSQLTLQQELIVDRSLMFRSIETEPEVCEFQTFLVTTTAGRRYLNFPFSKSSIPGIDEVLIRDQRIQSEFPPTEFEFDADASLEWKGSCLSKLELDDVLDDLLLQSQNDSRFESTIRELSIRVKTGDDDVLRKEVWKLISEMRTAGLVE